MSHPYIPRCLSLQAGLGFKGRLKRRNLSSAVPWASLQLRHASVLFAYFFQYNKGGQTESHDPGEFKESQLNYRGPWSVANRNERCSPHGIGQHQMGIRLLSFSSK